LVVLYLILLMLYCFALMYFFYFLHLYGKIKEMVYNVNLIKERTPSLWIIISNFYLELQTLIQLLTLNINILRILKKKLLKIVRLCSVIYICLTLCIALIVRHLCYIAALK